MIRFPAAPGWLLFTATILSIQLFSSSDAYGQAGLRATLEGLDKNNDGQIQPEEITPLARPYLERVAKARRLSLTRSNRIDKLQEAARVYHAIQNGVADERIRPESTSMVKGFGPEDDETVVPGFGVANMQYQYTKDDLEETERSMQRYDRNGDGFVDRREAERGKWTHRNPFEMDLNKDGLLSPMELTQRYARRRMLDAMSGELVKKAIRTGNGIEPSNPTTPERRDSSQYWRRGGTKTYLTATILGRFDSNKNGRLDEDEPSKLGIPKGRLDIDRDGEISRDELQQYVGGLQDDVGDTSEVVPGWFYELDKDRDGQITMVEFTEDWSDEKIAEFTSYDGNSDGMLTVPEILGSKALVGGSYTNKEAEIIPPRKTIISEIEVTDQFIVGDVNVHLSLTHSHTSYLDGYLTGPDGTRIELFTAVGAHDDNFDQTVFDDQSRHPITKARPPFKGTFMPEGLLRKEPGLAVFNDKPVKGVWQLVIRATRSDRFGMVHGWGLNVTPKSELIGGVAPQPLQDGPAMVSEQPRPERREAESRDRRSSERSYASSSSKVQERVAQADGWQRDIKARLASNEISEDERRGLTKKMEQIEKYKEHLQRSAEKSDKGDNGKEKKIKSFYKRK